MEEEVNYVAVAFRTNNVPAYEKPNDSVVIYEEVKPRDTKPHIPESRDTAPVCPLLHMATAALVIACVVLVSVVIALTSHFNAVISEQGRDRRNLTEQIQQLWGIKVDLERRTEELTAERDELNWTMGVILEHETFPVASFCPQRVCKPCQDRWLLFQSKCYHFAEYDYYSEWKTWEESQNSCRELAADLVAIESQEEQEFINNHTKRYRDNAHGYWIGLHNRNVKKSWMWTDRSNVTLSFWTTQSTDNKEMCALTLPVENPLANWKKTGCDMRNRWICEMRTLIK